jgi:hypothetical protein
MDIKLFGDKWVEPNSIDDLASRIFKCSVVGAGELKRASENPVSRPMWLSIVFEYVFFYVALVKRFSWAALPAEKQEKRTDNLSEVLITAVVDYVFEDGGSAANVARVAQFKAELAARMEEYGKFALFAGEAQSAKPEGTALWAFCVRVSALAGSPGDLVCIMATHAHVYDSMKLVGIEAPDSTGLSI